MTKDIPSGCVYAGNPAKFICTTEEYINKNRALMKDRPCYGEEYRLTKNVDKDKKDQMYRELENKIGFID